MMVGELQFVEDICVVSKLKVCVFSTYGDSFSPLFCPSSAAAARTSTAVACAFAVEVSAAAANVCASAASALWFQSATFFVEFVRTCLHIAALRG